jgi:predicted anti-sigma-YlaC factor YlaD
MRCEQWREAISAALDKEASPDDAAAADRHLTGCEACRVWALQAQRLSNRLRVRIADPVPDLSRAIVTAAGDNRRAGSTARRTNVLRVGLVGVAAAHFAVALSSLGGNLHSGNEAASWTIAAGVGLLSAAASPRRVLGTLPMLSAAALVLVLIAVRDVVGGQVHLGHELSHGLLIAGVALLWLLRGSADDSPHRDEDEIRGIAEALKTKNGLLIRLNPKRIISFGIDDPISKRAA